MAALVLATGAEVISFFAPDALAWKAAGMAVSALAIWLGRTQQRMAATAEPVRAAQDVRRHDMRGQVR